MLSYPVQCSPVVQKILPKNHCLGGQGMMRFTTTQRHDYYEPCVERDTHLLPPRHNLELPGGPMANLTTTNLSYQPQCASPAKTYKPVIGYNPPSHVMDFNTVNRSSYRNVGVGDKIETPWVVKPRYCEPVSKMECCTVYNMSFKYPCENVEAVDEERTRDRKAHQFE